MINDACKLNPITPIPEESFSISIPRWSEFLGLSRRNNFFDVLKPPWENEIDHFLTFNPIGFDCVSLTNEKSINTMQIKRNVLTARLSKHVGD